MFAIFGALPNSHLEIVDETNKVVGEFSWMGTCHTLEAALGDHLEIDVANIAHVTDRLRRLIKNAGGTLVRLS